MGDVNWKHKANNYTISNDNTSVKIYRAKS